ncbi:MAG: hypothetical protein JNK23_07220 [Opitutaceae bacterium]|nr:hypothetical protein [Opitutaceae bacterium]
MKSIVPLLTIVAMALGTVGAVCTARAQFSGVLTAYSPDASPPATITLFRGTFDSTARVASVSLANASASEFSLTAGTHFTALYDDFTRPTTLPTFNGFTLRVSIALVGRADTYTESWSPDGRTITIFSTPASIMRTFTGTTAADAANQYAAYYRSPQATSDFEKIQAAVLRIFGAVASAANMTDGAPQSSTANVALGSFEQFAFTPLTQKAGADELGATTPGAAGGKGAWSFSVFADNSRFKFDLPGGGEIKGSNVRLTAPYERALTPRLALRGVFAAQRSRIEGVTSYGPALTLGAPYSFREFTQRGPWRWVATPSVAISYDRVRDSAAGKRGSNFVGTGGVTHLVEKRLRPDLVASFATQISYHRTLSADLDFFPPQFEKIRQWVWKNGVRARWNFADRWAGEGFVVDTRFLREAQVKNFQSYGLGASYRIRQGLFVGLNTKIEDGPGYSGWDVGVASTWNF